MTTSVTCTEETKCAEIFRKGGIFVLRMRRRWPKSTAHMIAPIDEIADEEMGVADDGEGAGGAESSSGTPGGRTKGRSTTTTTTRGTVKFDATKSRSCATTQFDTLSISELVRGVCGIEWKD